MLRFFFLFFFGGEEGGGGVRQRAGITESLPSKWHHKIGSLLFCLQSEGMPEAVIPPTHTHHPPNGGNELCNLLQTCTQ